MRLLHRVLRWSLTLLAVATAVLWVRSYFFQDQISHSRGHLSWILNSNFGRLRFSRIPDLRDLPRDGWRIAATKQSAQPTQQGRARNLVNFIEFGNADARRLPHLAIMNRNQNRKSPLLLPYLVLPHAAIAIPAGLSAFLLYFCELYLRRRRLLGGCTACGYNLTGNVSGVCPECGAAAGAAGGPV